MKMLLRVAAMSCLWTSIATAQPNIDDYSLLTHTIQSATKRSIDKGFIFFQPVNFNCIKCPIIIESLQKKILTEAKDYFIVNVLVADRKIEAENLISNSVNYDNVIRVPDDGTLLKEWVPSIDIRKNIIWVFVDSSKAVFRQGSINLFKLNTVEIEKIIDSLAQDAANLIEIRVEKLEERAGSELVRPMIGGSINDSLHIVYDMHSRNIFVYNRYSWKVKQVVRIPDDIVNKVLHPNESIFKGGLGASPVIEIGGVTVDSINCLHIFVNATISSISDGKAAEMSISRTPIYLKYSFSKNKYVSAIRLGEGFAGVYSNPVVNNGRLYISGQIYKGDIRNINDYDSLYSVFIFNVDDALFTPIFNSDPVYSECNLGVNMLVTQFAKCSNGLYGIQTLGSNLYNLNNMKSIQLTSSNYQLSQDHFDSCGVCVKNIPLSMQVFINSPPQVSVDRLVTYDDSTVFVLLSDRRNIRNHEDPAFRYILEFYSVPEMKYLKTKYIELPCNEGFIRDVMVANINKKSTSVYILALIKSKSGLIMKYYEAD